MATEHPDNVTDAPGETPEETDESYVEIDGTERRRAFVDRFGDRIEVLHLHDNDGTADDHEPLPGYEPVVEAVGAPYNVFEMKRVADVARCLDGSG